MERDLSQHPLFVKLLSLDLDEKDYAVFGSGPLWIRGLRKEIGDLDLIAREAVFRELTPQGELMKSVGGDQVLRLFDGQIEIFTSWKGWWKEIFSIEDLLKSADLIQGIPFVSLSEVRRWKRSAGKEKDLLDIELIDNYFFNLSKEV